MHTRMKQFFTGRNSSAENLLCSTAAGRRHRLSAECSGEQQAIKSLVPLQSTGVLFLYLTLSRKHFWFTHCTRRVRCTLSYLCYLGQTAGDRIWRKTAPKPQRSSRWPVSWNCSGCCTASASRLPCSCEGVKETQPPEVEFVKNLMCFF